MRLKSLFSNLKVLLKDVWNIERFNNQVSNELLLSFWKRCEANILQKCIAKYNVPNFKTKIER